jgi:hypothetical protein
MTPRAALLAVASAAGLLTARALDGFGLLPGVTESPELRRAVLDPRLTALGLAACLVVGAVAARLQRVHPALAAGAVVAGQVGLVVSLEELGRELTGAPPPAGGETGLWVAAAVQLLLALVAVTTVLLLVLPIVGVGCGVRLGAVPTRLPSYPELALQVVERSECERGPPRRLVPAHPLT